MKRDLLDILACPICKTSLALVVEEEEDGGEIVKGSLVCDGCKGEYPIESSIPNLIPLNLRNEV